MSQTITHVATGLMGAASFWWRWDHPNKEQTHERAFFFAAAGLAAIWNLGSALYGLLIRV